MHLEYFTAAWCVPCKIFGPTIEEVTKRLDVETEKIDIDKNNSWSGKGVLGVPTVIMYNDGTEVSRIVGARSAQDLEDWIKSGGIG